MKQNNLIKLIFLFPFILILTGCWDLKGLDRQVFVIGIGLDVSDEKGKVDITYLIANPEVGSSMSGGGAEEDTVMTITMRSPDFLSLRHSANSAIAREIAYDLLRVIVVSEELAKDEEFIRFLYSAEKDREIKRNTYLIVTKEKAAEFLSKNDPKFLTRPHKFYENMIQRGIEVGFIPNSELHHFFRVTEEDANLFLATYATTNIRQKEDEYRINEMDALAGDVRIEGETNSANFLGAAVFLEGMMIGTLTGVENRIVMLLHDASSITDILAPIPDPFHEDYELTVRIRKQHNTSVEMNLHDMPPKIHVTLPLTVDVLTDPSMENPVDNKKKVEKLRSTMEEFMETKIMALVEKSQKEFKAEPFGWSLYARKEFKTLKDYMEFDWMRTYPEMKIDVDVEIRFGQFGRQPKTPSYKGIRD
ncbi:Ger(x)C family spore germination protein [Mesobacillus maritimus]|uniref:Ger(x)C family spore germination protein n=1 Tax=Mesobacillus maritimus TaxID=1643336 RepID=UPI00203B50EF|nr:Ger(x)C family spore germination protein [Mesobacillus maritimus]